MRLIDQFKAIFGGYHSGGVVRGLPNPQLMGEHQISQDDPRLASIRFQPTHQHVKTGGYYRVTRVGRLEVTGDEAYPLVEYEDADGKMFAQRSDRFFDGRFQEVLL